MSGLSDIGKKMKEKEEEIHQRQAQSKADAVEIVSLKEQIEKLNTEHGNLKKSLENLEKENSDLNKKRETFHNDNEKSAALSQLLHEEISKLKEELATTKGDIQFIFCT